MFEKCAYIWFLRNAVYFSGHIRKNLILFQTFVISKLKESCEYHVKALCKITSISWKIAGPFSLFLSTRISRIFFCMQYIKNMLYYSIFFEKMEDFLYFYSASMSQVDQSPWRLQLARISNKSSPEISNSTTGSSPSMIKISSTICPSSSTR